MINNNKKIHKYNYYSNNNCKKNKIKIWSVVYQKKKKWDISYYLRVIKKIACLIDII